MKNKEPASPHLYSMQKIEEINLCINNQFQANSNNKILNSLYLPQQTITLQLQSTHSDDSSDIEQYESIYFGQKMEIYEYEKLLQNYQNQGNILNLSIIQATKFYNLQTLNLNSCMLLTIQPLVSLKAFNLSELILTDNQIHTLESLSKCSFHRLKILHWNINFTNDGSQLYKGDWQNLEEIQFDKLLFQKIEDPRFLLKMKSTRIKPIQFKRIPLNSVLTSLENRYLKK